MRSAVRGAAGIELEGRRKTCIEAAGLPRLRSRPTKALQRGARAWRLPAAWWRRASGLMPVLEHWPMHEAVRREIEILDQRRPRQGAATRLRRAALAKRGASLGEASAQALCAGGPRIRRARKRACCWWMSRRGWTWCSAVSIRCRRAVHGRHSGLGRRACGTASSVSTSWARSKRDSEDLDRSSGRALSRRRVDRHRGCSMRAKSRRPRRGAAGRSATEHLGGLDGGSWRTCCGPDRLDARCPRAGGSDLVLSAPTMPWPPGG